MKYNIEILPSAKPIGSRTNNRYIYFVVFVTTIVSSEPGQIPKRTGQGKAALCRFISTDLSIRKNCSIKILNQKVMILHLPWQKKNGYQNQCCQLDVARWHHMLISTFTYSLCCIVFYICLHLCAYILQCSQILNKTVFFYIIFYCSCCQTTGWIWNSDWNAAH